MAEFPSPSPASINRGFQHLELTDSEEQQVQDVDPVKEDQADPTDGNRRRTLWEDVESWLRRGAIQQRAEEIGKQHRCLGQRILDPRTCTGKQSQSPCHATSCQTCVDLNYFSLSHPSTLSGRPWTPLEPITLPELPQTSPPSKARPEMVVRSVQLSTRESRKC